MEGTLGNIYRRSYMKITYYSTFTVTYLTPISNQSGDDIFYESYSFESPDGIPEHMVDELLNDMYEGGAVTIKTSEGLLYLNGSNIASIMFHEEDI